MRHSHCSKTKFPASNFPSSQALYTPAHLTDRKLSVLNLHSSDQWCNDRQELARFLVEHHITLESVGIVVPPEYDRALRDALPEVIEAEAKDVGDE